MQITADLHFHSKYSRAVSQQMVLPEIAKWANFKGIDLVTTADFTHPLWLREIKANLEEKREGIYRVKGQEKPLFLLTTEISSIYTQNGKLRRIHNLVFAPNLEEAEKIETELARRGNVMSDGRPIFGLSARDIADLILNLSPEALIVPAHCWTPHFALYGSESGFDSIEECFGDMAKNIYAVETGLSSSPEMNWRVGELDRRSIISCSDAHSGAKLGREATVFEIEDIKKLRYEDIREAIRSGGGKWEMGREVGVGSEEKRGKPHISYTIEFYPEEGKYHYTGHRNCNVRQSPEETRRLGEVCPVCGKHLTVGVMHRVEELATREISAFAKASADKKNEKPASPTGGLKIKNDEKEVKWIGYENRPPYVMLVPLLEILAESLNTIISSQKVISEYRKLTENFRGEFGVLLNTDISEIAKISGLRIAEGIKKVRSGDIVVDPGYDGVFGTVKIWPEGKDVAKEEEEKEQLALF
ncbi:MAG: endonuclease Q family protein [Patescibacteria group bacterium]